MDGLKDGIFGNLGGGGEVDGFKDGRLRLLSRWRDSRDSLLTLYNEIKKIKTETENTNIFVMSQKYKYIGKIYMIFTRW